MVFKKNNPGCPCCFDPCEIYHTRFPTSAAFDSQWTIVDGDTFVDWISADLITIDGGAALVIADMVHPTADYPSRVRVRVNGESGALLRAIASYSADDSYLFAEFEPGATCGFLRMYRQDGSETLLSEIAVPGGIENEWHELRLCFDPCGSLDDGYYGTTCVPSLTATIITSDGSSVSASEVPYTTFTPGSQAGIAAGNASESHFANFRFDRLYYFDEDNDGIPDVDPPSEETLQDFTLRIYCDDCTATGCFWLVSHFTDTGYHDCDWDDDADDWTIDAANEWMETTTGAAILWQFAGGANPHYVLATFYCSVDGGSFSVLLHTSDDLQDGLKVTVEVGVGNENTCGRITMHKIVAGVSTQINDPAVVWGIRSGEWYSMKAELSPDGILRMNLANSFTQERSFAYDCTPSGAVNCVYYSAAARTSVSYSSGGDRVGIAADPNGGEVRLLSLTASCFRVADFCMLDQDLFYEDQLPATGLSCRWDGVGGTDPVYRVVGFPDVPGGFEWAADGAVLFLNPTTDRDAHEAEGYFSATEYSDVFGVIVGSDIAAVDYYLAEVKVSDIDGNGGYVRLYTVNGGVKTQIKNSNLLVWRSTGASYNHRIRVCLSGDNVTINYTDLILDEDDEVTETITKGGEESYGPYCGLAVEPVDSGNSIQSERFKIFGRPFNGQNLVQDTADCEDHCWQECVGACLNDLIPATYLVEITGVESADCDAANINADFYVSDYVEGSCYFSETFDDITTCLTYVLPGPHPITIVIRPNRAIRRIAHAYANGYAYKFTATPDPGPETPAFWRATPLTAIPDIGDVMYSAVVSITFDGQTWYYGIAAGHSVNPPDCDFDSDLVFLGADWWWNPGTFHTPFLEASAVEVDPTLAPGFYFLTSGSAVHLTGV